MEKGCAYSQGKFSYLFQHKISIDKIIMIL